MSRAQSITSTLSPLQSSIHKDLWDSIDSYNDICFFAAGVDWIFQNFRQHGAYKRALEHVTVEQGEACINHINSTGKICLSTLSQLISLNDIYGNPFTASYGRYGHFSPTTLRYAKITSDILKIFEHNGEPLTVVEIGVGYGGQCRLLTEFLNVKEYYLVDISPALKLAKRYLEGFVIKSKLVFLTLNEIGKMVSDLCISNYAFSELNKDLQDAYIEKIILHTQTGYMIYNQITERSYETYTAQQFLEKLNQPYKILEENPLTHPDNKLVIWDNRRNSGVSARV